MSKAYRPMPVFTSDEASRFWSKVRQTSTCWEWTGKAPEGRYGHFVAGKLQLYAHRAAYYLHYQVDPQDQCVCHTCDNTKCVNPAHLFLGTHVDNVQDMMAKGRHVQGNGVPQSKLTPEQVEEIRLNYKSRTPGKSLYAFARKFGVAPATVFRALHRVCWKHL